MDQNPEVSQATPKQQVVERVREATNVLVTVRSNPTVDELSATIGLTLMLNKLGKHATAVFSGKIPSTLEFLKPEDTIETNTDSLRDFIVSLDKSKADKLRYKVEENVVKIFITPYRTSITEKDLEFTQGDFNVDVVMALGVTVREELDQAITSHGRILHDATVMTITAGHHESALGAINWQEPAASSLSEMLVSVSEAFQGGIIDEQMATAFLTGIVSETERFSNPKTSPKVMTMAAQLMAAGANQQLISSELNKIQDLPVDVPASVPHDDMPPLSPVASDDGSLTITHDKPADGPVAPEHAIETGQSEQKNDLQAQTAGDDIGFLSPEPETDQGNSFEPLLSIDASADKPAEYPEVDETLKDMFASLDEPKEPKTEDENQIHIDEQGNIKSERPIAPKHKVIEPLGAQPTIDVIEPLQSPALERTAEEPYHGPGDEITPSNYAAAPEVIAPEPVVPEIPELSLPPLPSQPEPAEQEPPQPEPEAAPEALEPEAPEIDPSQFMNDDTTLLDIEKTLHSPHVEQQSEAAGPSEADDVDHARNAVMDAINQAGYDTNRPDARADLGAHPLDAPTPEIPAADVSDPEMPMPEGPAPEAPAPEFAAPESTVPPSPAFEAPEAPVQPDLTFPTPPAPVLNGFDPSAPQPGQSQDNDNTLPPPPPIPPPMMPLQ